MNQETYRNLISGHRQGLRAMFWRRLLTVASWPYSLVVRLRNRCYSLGLFRAHRVDAAVISVGNLTAGGTGKTPLTIWLCRLMQPRGLHCCILTRGYKMREEHLSDEPALLAAKCPGVHVVVQPDRVAGARQAISRHGAQALILDDGFQHRRLARDIDIVTIDATLPFGYDRLLPAGLLREPVAGLQRADAVVMTRCDQVSEERLAQIEGRIRRIHPRAVIARSIHAPVNAITSEGAEIGLEELRGKRVFAVCGLGNPEAFFDTIRRIGCVLTGCRSFDDHHDYAGDCLSQIHRQAKEHNVDYIVTTQKDWTKISRLTLPGHNPPMAFLSVELEFTAGTEPLIALIDRVLTGKMSNVQGAGK